MKLDNYPQFEKDTDQPISCKDFQKKIDQIISRQIHDSDILVEVIDHTRTCKTCADYFLEKIKK